MGSLLGPRPRLDFNHMGQNREDSDIRLLLRFFPDSRYTDVCCLDLGCGFMLEPPCRRQSLGAAQLAHIRCQRHVCFCMFWGAQKICTPPWGSVTAGFSQKGRRNHMFAGIDASPLVKRDTLHDTYAPQPSRKREIWRSIYGSAIRRYVWRKA